MDAAQKPFLMAVEDVFSSNRGRIVRATGRIERGRICTGDGVEIVGFGGDAVVRVTGVDGCGPRAGEALAGMNVGLLLPSAAAGAVVRGQVLAAPGSIGAHVAFGADVALLTEDQGGSEVRTGEGLDFCVRAGAVRGVVTLPPGTDALQPLHMAAVTVTLERPVALEVGQSFAVRHRGRAAGSGTVTRLRRGAKHVP
ncbi:hypothetical protein GCM10010377_51290 [Streptomyces viridiviolaceus]|uniref:Translation elongation factor EFTu/EF1A C-terminal domain-containing protein n=1 Tax=Streptomyces viridiviolaceus TaxID=68282 RepID=A0ABW2E5L3_9ACTN|nr:hypothetical protein [Streptomyces viridiviolaceus]GHB54034.1 hypothetical protein GCM10010377_51290 [Streptomyces viridiviolaceus]